MLQRIFILALFFICAHSRAAEESRVKEVAHSYRWLRLLHYKSHWFTGFRSAIDGEKFFFSPEGHKDPEKELLATVEAFTKRPEEKVSRLAQPPACAFPARFRYLNEELKLGLKSPACPRVDEFLSRFGGAESVTLVFSTAYPNNPASMFGHSFLRINSKAQPGKPKLDLLDYGLSYAAQVADDENNFIFVWNGLTGGYVGTFSATPYYAKVQEYVSSESRDLWEYDLNLSADETWWLLANVWEIEVNSHSDYYFFDENCSFEILTLLEVAKPEWNVSSYLFHMIPGESVKNVTNTPGAVKNVKYRPSLFKKLMAYGERLEPAERENFFKVIRGENVEQASVATLDTAAQYFLYLKQQKSGKLSEAEGALFQKVLQARSRRGASPPEPEFDQTSRPELGHPPSRVSLGFGSQKGSGDHFGSFQEIGLKFAYHDLLNHDLGFVPFSEISFPNFLFRYFPDEKRFWLHRAEILSINSFSPWSWLKNSLSWRAVSAYEVPMDICSFCHVMHVEGDVGVSQSIAKDRFRAYEMVGIYAELGKPLRQKWRAGSRMLAGILANVTSSWKHQLELSLVSDPLKGGGQAYFFSGFYGQSLRLSQSWEARLLGRGILRTDNNAQQSKLETQVQILSYF